MVNTVVKMEQFWVVNTVVKRERFWVVNTVVKREQFCVVIRRWLKESSFVWLIRCP